jgi:hypothetical protein
MCVCLNVGKSKKTSKTNVDSCPAEHPGLLLDLLFPEELFLSPQATSCIPDLLRNFRVDFFFPEELFLRSQAAFCILLDLLRDQRVDFFFPEELLPQVIHI